MAEPMDEPKHGAPSKGSAWVPQIYFARAMDGIDEAVSLAFGVTVARELAQYSLRIIDPLTEAKRRQLTQIQNENLNDLLVEFDLGLLRRSDGVLMDMSIPGRNYVGCVCELTYAFMWRIPVAVYVGDSSNGERHWLKYHATQIYRTRQDAIVSLAALVRSEAARLRRLT
jgi:hypothetical protein